MLFRSGTLFLISVFAGRLSVCVHVYTTPDLRGGVAQWAPRLTRNVEVVGSSPSKAPVVSLSKKLYPCCLVLVGSRNGFERDNHNRTKIN